MRRRCSELLPDTGLCDVRWSERGCGLERVETDFIVIGSGVAGLRAALDLAPAGRVLILTKTDPRESNSRYAQGGIAAAVGEDDSVELHLADTIAAGAGLCDKEAVRILAREGPPEVERLISWGAGFDRQDGRIELGREGAHSRARVLHAQGDATGKEIVRALSDRVQRFESVQIVPFAFVQQLILDEGSVAGVRFASRDGLYEASAGATLIASGGAGQVYPQTTNPPVATGDGYALGLRAGAVLRDMEFVQFHPTALKLPNTPPFLISEAVRGEGARLIDAGGRRFVDELAPRDVVARAIYEHLNADSAVFLDLRHLPAAAVRERFPHIHSFCRERGFDITRDPLPVVPAAHYFMGGLYTDMDGRTTVRRLFAAGEVASAGVHGGNRLASNSLLECVVFGRRAAAAMLECDRSRSRRLPKTDLAIPTPQGSPDAVRSAIQDAAWRGGGIVRTAAGLREALEALDRVESGWQPDAHPSVEALEAANLAIAARVILQSALARMESRGAHYRTDYPARNDREFGFHSWVDGAGKALIGPRAA